MQLRPEDVKYAFYSDDNHVDEEDQEDEEDEEDEDEGDEYFARISLNYISSRGYHRLLIMTDGFHFMRMESAQRDRE